MAARFSFCQTTGEYPGVRDSDLGSFGELFAFSGDDSFGTNKPAILRGSYSYELWLQARFDGAFDSIHDLWAWFALGSKENRLWEDVEVRMGCAQAYRTPVSTPSDIATTLVPLNDRGLRNVTIGGSLDGRITVPSATTDFLVLQIHALADVPRGFLTLKQFVLTYLEDGATFDPS